MPPRISAICIFLNEERFLDQAVRSVFAQDFDDWELILVDDGSTDGSSATAQGWAQRHPDKVHYLDHPGHANLGMSAARNAGLAMARGELITFLDGDDCWRPAKLREQVALLDATPEAMVVRGALNYWSSWNGGADKVAARGLPHHRLMRPPETALRLYPLGTAPAVSPEDSMIRREMFDLVGGFVDEFTSLYEDQAFFAKVYLTAPILSTTCVWVDYRQHDGNCVQQTHATGTYASQRRRFLQWLEDWIEARHLHAPITGYAAVKSALSRELWKLDHPFAGKLVTRLQRLVGR